MLIIIDIMGFPENFLTRLNAYVQSTMFARLSGRHLLYILFYSYTKITCRVTVMSSAGVFLLCFFLVRNNLMTVAAEEICCCFAGIAIADNCITCSFLLHATQSSLRVQYTLFSSSCNDSCISSGRRTRLPEIPAQKIAMISASSKPPGIADIHSESINNIPTIASRMQQSVPSGYILPYS